MKYQELSDESKRIAEREIYEEMRDLPEFKAMFKALIMQRADRYDYDKDGHINK